MLKKILITFAVILLIIQFIRPEKNIAAAPSATNIATHYSTPDNVKKSLSVLVMIVIPIPQNTLGMLPYNQSAGGWQIM